MEMTNENGNRNDLPDNDPAFKWAWEIYREADHLVHSRTTFFFVAQSFLVVAYSTFAVNRFNWKENQGIYIFAMGIIVLTGIIFSLILWEINYTVTKRMKERLRDPYLERDKMWKEYAETKMATCQNNFRHGYSGLPAFDLDRLRDNYLIDI
jgi:hypothetical protein